MSAAPVCPAYPLRVGFVNPLDPSATHVAVTLDPSRLPFLHSIREVADRAFDSHRASCLACSNMSTTGVIWFPITPAASGRVYSTTLGHEWIRLVNTVSEPAQARFSRMCLEQEEWKLHMVIPLCTALQSTRVDDGNEPASKRRRVDIPPPLTPHYFSNDCFIFIESDGVQEFKNITVYRGLQRARTAQGGLWTTSCASAAEELINGSENVTVFESTSLAATARMADMVACLCNASDPEAEDHGALKSLLPLLSIQPCLSTSVLVFDLLPILSPARVAATPDPEALILELGVWLVQEVNAFLWQRDMPSLPKRATPTLAETFADFTDCIQPRLTDGMRLLILFVGLDDTLGSLRAFSASGSYTSPAHTNAFLAIKDALLNGLVTPVCDFVSGTSSSARVLFTGTDILSVVETRFNPSCPRLTEGAHGLTSPTLDTVLRVIFHHHDQPLVRGFTEYQALIDGILSLPKHLTAGGCTQDRLLDIDLASGFVDEILACRYGTPALFQVVPSLRDIAMTCTRVLRAPLQGILHQFYNDLVRLGVVNEVGDRLARLLRPSRAFLNQSLTVPATETAADAEYKRLLRILHTRGLLNTGADDGDDGLMTPVQGVASEVLNLLHSRMFSRRPGCPLPPDLSDSVLPPARLDPPTLVRILRHVAGATFSHITKWNAVPRNEAQLKNMLCESLRAFFLTHYGWPHHVLQREVRVIVRSNFSGVGVLDILLQDPVTGEIHVIEGKFASIWACVQVKFGRTIDADDMYRSGLGEVNSLKRGQQRQQTEDDFDYSQFQYQRQEGGRTVIGDLETMRTEAKPQNNVYCTAFRDRDICDPRIVTSQHGTTQIHNYTFGSLAGLFNRVEYENSYDANGTFFLQEVSDFIPDEHGALLRIYDELRGEKWSQ